MTRNDTLFELAEAWQAGTLPQDDERLKAPGMAAEFARWKEALEQTRWLDEPLERESILNDFQRQAVAQIGQQALVLGNYQLQDLIGRGGMGEVYRAKHRYLERTVAIKLLLPSRGSLIDRGRFLRESQALAQLDHRHIVKVYDAFEEGDHFAIVTEFVEGQTLAALLQRKDSLPLSDLVQWGTQTASGLQHAHARGIIHRDIKPSNLMLTPAGDIKVLDLGISKILTLSETPKTSLTFSGLIIGTPDYLAPEQFFDARRVDFHADIYSLGATLFHLTTGQPPYCGAAFGETILLHRESPLPKASALRPALPPEWDRFFDKALAKAPKDRFASMDALATALARLPTDEISVAPAQPSSWRLSRRALIGAGAISTALVAGSAWLGTKLPAPGRARLTVYPPEATSEMQIVAVGKTKGPIDVLTRDTTAGELLLAIPFGQVQVEVTHPAFPTAFANLYVDETHDSAATAGWHQIAMVHTGPKEWKLLRTPDANSFFLSLADEAWNGWKTDYQGEKEGPWSQMVMLKNEGDGSMYVRINESAKDVVQLQVPNSIRQDHRFMGCELGAQMNGTDSLPVRLNLYSMNGTYWRMRHTESGGLTFELRDYPGHFLAPLPVTPHLALDGQGRLMRSANPIHAKRIVS